MFRRLSEFAVHVANLAEAEGRELRVVIARLGLGFSITLVGASLLLAGALFFLASVWLLLHEPVGKAGASAITGVVAMLMAGGALYAASRIHKLP